MDYCISYSLYLLRRNALEPALMPNECVINNVFVFAQNDLTNKSLQIWMTPPPSQLTTSSSPSIPLLTHNPYFCFVLASVQIKVVAAAAAVGT